jgi:quinoprotein relay system zinc metallohydrolase 1
MMRRGILILLTLLLANPAAAQALDYGLKPIKIAADTYVFPGRTETFTSANGGNIVNTGFIVTSEGVVVIDTGPSLLYGLEMRRAIRTVTQLPVIRVINTHLHPDHVFGNQAFSHIQIEALPGTMHGLEQQAKGFSDSMYRLVGPWMQGTEPRLPNKAPPAGIHDIGGHSMEMIPSHGHTDSDLMVLDHSTGVLFASDLVFLDRAPTTPHAHVADWLSALDRMERLAFRVLVPGHGPVSRGTRAIAQTRDWLIWLEANLRKAAADGLDMTEAMALPIPERFRHMARAREELTRSVSHLYPTLEAAAMPRAN